MRGVFKSANSRKYTLDCVYVLYEIKYCRCLCVDRKIDRQCEVVPDVIAGLIALWFRPLYAPRALC